MPCFVHNIAGWLCAVCTSQCCLNNHNHPCSAAAAAAVAINLLLPGIYVKPGRDRDALQAILIQEGYLPVWLEGHLLDPYYNGFCNSVLWQLFHYVPLNLDSWQGMTEHQTMKMQWTAYQQANERFGEVVLKAYQLGDIVWVQDYHLMLLPSILKNSVPKMKVG